MNNFYKNKKILVTGATGFKGSWLCCWLLQMGAKVYGTGYSPNQNKNLFYQLKLNKKIKKDFQNVGKNFAKEARKAAKGKRDQKFYGTTTKKEANELLDEGIDLFAVPDYKDN